LEGEAVGMHGPGADDQDDRPAATGADLARGRFVRRQVHVMPPAGLEPLAPDVGHEPLDGAVVEQGRRRQVGMAERVTAPLWPCTARIIVPSALKAKRCFGFVATIASSSARASGVPARVRAASSASTETHPAASSEMPMLSGRWRS